MPFGLDPLVDARIGSDSGAANFQRVDGEFDLLEGPFAAVKLTLELKSTCYPFETWKTNKPPAGQNWPADCDAFDRNLDVTIDDPAGAGEPPAFDVIHAITPFGGPEHLEADLTDLANAHPGHHRVRVTIPTYSDGAGKVSGSSGGWNVSVHLEVTPGPAPRRVLAAIPLAWTTQTDSADLPSVPFTVPAGVTSARLEVRTSGHGGGTGDADCVGPAEEFCHRGLDVLMDAQGLTPTVDPWRDDCDSYCTRATYTPFALTYCMENPCGSIASVEAPRANWCPGSMTEPFVWDPAAAHSPGTHAFSWHLSKLAAGGSWQLSAIYYAFGE